MAKKNFYMIVDTETTINNTVADLGIIICDKNGNIEKSLGVLVKGHYDTMELFHDKNANDIWGYGGLIKRKAAYVEMLDNGSRMLASVNAINNWIAQAIGKYNPEITAYNLAFDKDKLKNTGIDITGVKSEFCLWQAAVGTICNTKLFRNFALQNDAFNNGTT